MRVLILALALIAADTPASYRAEIEKYRQDRVAELTAPNGWLAVAGLFWLHDGANSAGSDAASEVRLPARAPKTIGVFTLKDRQITFAADPSAGVTAAGAPVTSFTFEPQRGEQSAITVAGVTLFSIRRGNRVGLRMLDPDSTQRKTFRGLKYFPLNSAYHVRAKFVPYEKPKTVPVPNVLGMLVPMESPGYVEFALKGRTYHLEPVYETSKHEDLFFIFKDLTSRTETYEAGRFLHTPLPSAGFVDLDFNRAYSPPCAFTAFATCPLPIKENQLDVRIPAGELKHHPGRF
ncbi:MAG TPA: DUF1684 domain-containing protein [Vicinamibacterales bacterium]|nr:DUF1684 domain-containing protein [Vicinamibacterales bacterium]